MAKSEVTSNANATPTKTPHLAFTTISNVKLHVPVLLRLSQPNYKKWSRLFLLLVSRFNLQGYINCSVVPLSEDDNEWLQLDAFLQGWILSTISDEISDLVISSVSTASALWKVIHDLFHDRQQERSCDATRTRVPHHRQRQHHHGGLLSTSAKSCRLAGRC
ncbi:unnamed protein product [Cuscuta campestris]|uniref:Retrotransposon Copia-like N-terminal domain-containing protein n=1 Tax=Cuscuta campestris TaxID=132261 RepID=A0A484KUS1_9ASTE|nr:unnamed protein product [Cuscuta campestris]